MGSPPSLQSLGSSYQEVSPSVGKSLGREEALGPTGTQKQSSMLPVTKVLTTYVLSLQPGLRLGSCGLSCPRGLAGAGLGWLEGRRTGGDSGGAQGDVDEVCPVSSHFAVEWYRPK